MWYAILGEDVSDSQTQRKLARPDHLARLEELKQQGRLLVAGPHPKIDCDDAGNAGCSGSLIIAEFENLNAAQRWADTDPYVSAGVYARVIVKPFKRVLP